MRGSGNTLEIRQRWLISRSQQVSILTAWGANTLPGLVRSLDSGKYPT